MRLHTLLLAGCCLATQAQAAEEFPIGAEVIRNNLAIAPNYLTGIEMDPMPKDMAMGPDAIHLEADIHAAKGETHGFAAGSWMPYLTITYSIEKTGTDFKKTGWLWPMTAGDGPHYADNVTLPGPGQYHLTYRIEPPSKQGFIRHIDKATGVPPWWEPFAVDWDFAYPAKSK